MEIKFKSNLFENIYLKFCGDSLKKCYKNKKICSTKYNNQNPYIASSFQIHIKFPSQYYAGIGSVLIHGEALVWNIQKWTGQAGKVRLQVSLSSSHCDLFWKIKNFLLFPEYFFYFPEVLVCFPKVPSFYLPWGSFSKDNFFPS